MRIIYLIVCLVAWSIASIAQTPVLVSDYQSTTFYNWQDAIQNAKTAKTLDLSGWRLAELPEAIGGLKNLVHLDLSNNPIQQLPSSFSNLQNLESITMKNAWMMEVNPFFEQLTKLSKLQQLDLEGMKLMYLPRDLGQLRGVQQLNLADNDLEELSKEFYFLEGLKTLDLSNNKLKKLSKKLRFLSTLTSLDLSFNDELKTPKDVKYLEELVSLKTLKWQGKKRFFEVISRLPNLEFLDLSHGTFSDFYLAETEQLKTIHLNYCDKLDFRSTFKRLKKAKNLSTLEIRHNQPIIARGLGQLKSLEYLVMSGQQLEKIPTDLKHLKNLRKIDLINSISMDWSSAFRQLAKVSNLEILVLTSCKINKLPTSVGLLKNIKHLYLNANQLTDLPKSFYQLTQLESLNLYGNSLEESTLKKLRAAFPDCDIQFPVFKDGQREDLAIKITNTFLPTEKNAGIAPPISTAQIPIETHKVNAAKESEINLESGTIIRVPENAFVDKNGNPVQGKVDVKYREFNDPTAIYLSGIPMTYQAEGKEFQFKSAGMFQITAEQNGEEVLINPDRPLEVELNSYDDGENFNYYAFDEKANVWETIKNETEIITPNNTVNTLRDNWKRIEVPRKPRDLRVQTIFLERFSSKNTPLSFRINYNFDKLTGFSWVGLDGSLLKFTTALNEYDRIHWVYDGRDRKTTLKALRKIFRPISKYGEARKRKRRFKREKKRYQLYFSNWITDIKIEPNFEKDNYWIKFYTQKDSITIAAYPRFRSTYKNTIEQRRNSAFHKKYQYLLKQRCEKWKEEEAASEAAFDKYEKEMETYRRLSVLKQNKGSLAVMEVKRVLIVRDRRIHNVDKPLFWYEEQFQEPMILTFRDEQNQNVIIEKVSVLNERNNTVVTVNQPRDMNKIVKLKNATIIIDIEGEKIGVAKNLNLKKMNEQGGEHIIKLQTKQKDKMTVKKIKALLASN